MFPLFGIRLIESLIMVDQTHIGTQLNGYRASPNRSKRLWKKLVIGTRKKRPIVEPLIETTPKPDIYQLPNGDIVGHPAIIQRLKSEMNANAVQLGMPKWRE